jgi:AraC-like DNA-binding protein
VTVGSIDNEFMEKLHAEVMKHLSEQDLNIEALTSILGTSKSTLYRKIKANTGLNINEYIRLCRLKEAAEMLSSQKYRINEVAYLVGFSSPSYFTTSFQKQFNISPSAFVKRIRQEE